MILSSAQFSLTQRALFSSHQLASTHLIEALLNIFIDIEFTGESMEFEDKFRECVCVGWGVCGEGVSSVRGGWCVHVCVCVPPEYVKALLYQYSENGKIVCSSLHNIIFWASVYKLLL